MVLSKYVFQNFLDLANAEKFKLFHVSFFDVCNKGLGLIGVWLDFRCWRSLLTWDKVSLDVLTTKACFGDFDVLFQFFDQVMEDLKVDLFLGRLAVDKNEFNLVVEL